MDHCLISLELCWTTDNKGRGNWKFNNSYLQNDNFVKMTKKHIEDFRHEYKDMEYDNLKWNPFKASVKSVCINYGINKRNMEIKLESYILLECPRVPIRSLVNCLTPLLDSHSK